MQSLIPSLYEDNMKTDEIKKEISLCTKEFKKLMQQAVLKVNRCKKQIKRLKRMRQKLNKRSPNV